MIILLLICSLCGFSGAVYNRSGIIQELTLNNRVLDKNEAGIVSHARALSLVLGKPSNGNTRMTLEQFGAKGDGVNDDTEAIRKALNSPVPVIYTGRKGASYKISDKITVDRIKKKKLIAAGATFLNYNLTKPTFFFLNCSGINIEGGNFGYAPMPTDNGNGSQHLFQFEGCENVIVSRIHIINSPEMGIAITNSNKVIIQNSLIEHTFRDGTYSHYSANVKYLNNLYRYIKDDAMSFHDYGLTVQKTQLLKFGYSQATNLIAQGNTVEHCYQGFGSIGAANVAVLNNKFKNTVIAGVSIFNAMDMHTAGTALARKSKIQNNTIISPCTTEDINGVVYSNNGQASTGRAGICLLSLGAKNQLNQGESKRLTDITVSGNTVIGSGANGFFANLVDSLKLINNRFINCSGAVPTKSLNGDVIEIWHCTGLVADANTVIDTRVKALHQHAYAFINVAGQMSNWNIKGVIRGDSVLIETPSLRLIPKRISQLRVKK